MTDKPASDRYQSTLDRDTGGESGMDLARMIGIVSESRWLVLGLSAAVLALGLIYSFVRTPIYEADAILQVIQPSGNLSGLQQLSTVLQGNALPTDTEIQLLKTRAVLVPVINKLGLAIKAGDSGHGAKVSVFNVPTQLQGKQFEIVPLRGGHYRLIGPGGHRLLEGTVGKPATGSIETLSGKQIVNIKVDAIHAQTGTHLSLVRIPTTIAIKDLLNRLSIGELGQQTGVIRVSLQGTSPRKIAQELNEIVRTNVKLNIRENSTQAANQLQFVNSQLPDIRKRLDKAQAQLASFLSQHEALALSQGSQYLIQSVTTLEQQISPLKAQLAVAHSSLGSENPHIKALQSQLAALEAQRKALIASVQKLPTSEQKLVRLQENVDISKSLYSAMLNQMQTLQIATAGSVGDVVIVDHAIVPARPVLPNHALDGLVALVVGLLAGVAAAFIRRALHQGIEDPEVLEDAFGLPVHAVLMHSRMQQRLGMDKEARHPGSTMGLLAAQSEPDNTVESLNSLRTSLQFSTNGSSQHILCIPSLGPGEGKSFVCSNLAYLMAKSGKRVLLVDADMRRGHLHKVFGWTRGKGFAQYLAGEASVGEVIQRTDVEGLDVVTSGALPDDAANLLLASDLKEKLEALTADRDLVIIDVPPVLAVSDAFSIARYATLNLLLLKYGRHSLRQVRLVLKRFERHGIGIVGSIFNDVSSGATRYAYHQYGYQYKYQYKSRD